LALRVASAALDASGRSYRIVGAEYQGTKERAVLWAPGTYGEWFDAFADYWNALLQETSGYEGPMRGELNSTILDAALSQVQIPARAEQSISALERIADDPSTDLRNVHRAIEAWVRRQNGEETRSTVARLRRIQGRISRRGIEARFLRYVVDSTWDSWEDFQIRDDVRVKDRAKRLVKALAKRAALDDLTFSALLKPMTSLGSETAALYVFGETLGATDREFRRLAPLVEGTLAGRSSQCLGGYLQHLGRVDESRRNAVIFELLAKAESASLGVEMIARSGVNKELMEAWISAVDHNRVPATSFDYLSYGSARKQISKAQLARVIHTLAIPGGDRVTARILARLLDDSLGLDDWPVETEFVYSVVIQEIHFGDSQDQMHGYHWHKVCESLLRRAPACGPPLLDVLLSRMQSDYALSYDHYVAPLAYEICLKNPAECWTVIARHLLSVTQKWRADLLSWLKGGHPGFNEGKPKAPIAAIPVEAILSWVAEDPEWRAGMIAHCAPRTLDDDAGGGLTRALLSRYRRFEGVESGIGATFHSGGWQGPESQYLRTRRDVFRSWLSQGFDAGVNEWVEGQIRYLDKRIEHVEMEEERDPWSRPSRVQ
jgi:hypothetical protein